MKSWKRIAAKIPFDLTDVMLQITAVGLAIVVSGLIISLIGKDPFKALQILLLGPLKNWNAFSETVVKMTPLILTGLSYAYAVRAGLINIGAEGQLYMGGFLATWVGVNLAGLPMVIHLPLTLAAGLLAGGLWGLLVGWLKVRFGANEIITTVLLNYVAIYFISYLVTGPMKAPPGNYPQSEVLAASALLPRFVEGMRMHWGIVVALLAAVAYYIVMWKMKLGYEVRVVGCNPEAARYAGMRPERSMLTVMFIAGGMGGLAGAIEIMAIQERLIQGFSPGYGYDGIAVSLVGMNSPVGIVLGALLFGILRAGGNLMQMIAQVPFSIIYVVQGLVIMFVIAGQMVRHGQIRIGSYRLQVRPKQTLTPERMPAETASKAIREDKA